MESSWARFHAATSASVSANSMNDAVTPPTSTYQGCAASSAASKLGRELNSSVQVRPGIGNLTRCVNSGGVDENVVRHALRVSISSSAGLPSAASSNTFTSSTCSTP